MLPKIEIDAVASELRKTTPRRIIEQVVELRQISAESMAKIESEGTVVRTLKGDVIAHPSLKIHADAIKAEESLLKNWADRSKR